MENKTFSEESVKRAKEMFQESLNYARGVAQEGDFLTLQGQLRSMEKEQKNLSYAERLETLEDRMKSLEAKMEINN